MAPSETPLNSHKPINLYTRSILATIWYTHLNHWYTLMKMTLNQSIIINKLSIDVKPSLDPQGRVVYLPNPERKPYLITDNHRDSPVGFGVKISATKKTYIVQRRVSVAECQRQVKSGSSATWVEIFMPEGSLPVA